MGCLPDPEECMPESICYREASPNQDQKGARPSQVTEMISLSLSRDILLTFSRFMRLRAKSSRRPLRLVNAKSGPGDMDLALASIISIKNNKRHNYK